MMCYRDMTFCNGNDGKCLSFNTCHRALTKETWAKAEAAGWLIAQYMNPEKLECYQQPIEKQDNDTTD